jgi:hypothetical protein
MNRVFGSSIGEISQFLMGTPKGEEKAHACVIA